MSHRPGSGPGGIFRAKKAKLTRPVGQLLKGLGRYLAPQWKNYLLGAFFTMIYSVTLFISPLYLSKGIDLLTVAGGNKQLARRYVLLFAGITIFGWIVQSLSTRVLSKTRAYMLHDIRTDLFDRLLYADIGYLKKEQSGNVTARITGDTEEVGGGLSVLINASVQLIILIGSYTVLIVNTHWVIALVAMASIPIALFMSWVLSSYGRRLVANIRKAFGEVSAKMAEHLAGIAVSKSFNREEDTARQLKKLNQIHYKYNKKFAMLMQSMMPTISLVSTLTAGVILVVGGYLYIKGLLTLGDIYLSIVLSNRFLAPVMTLAVSWPQLQSSLGAMDRILDVLDLQPTIVDTEESEPLQTTDDTVYFDHVWFAYEDDHYVLEDITFTAQAGETVAVVGETGAGKTTLLTVLLPRFYDPQKGQIRIGSQDIRRVKIQELRNALGIILQEPYLFTGTVMENIKYARPDASDEEVKHICKLIGADEFIEALPQGYETRVIEGGKKLSAGQRQMITIARTMLSNPRFLILDEATSRLDAYSESKVQAAQEKLFEGRTTFVIAHRLSTIRNADKIVVLHRGKVVEIGTHEELLAKGGIYAELFYTYYSFQGFERIDLTEEEWQRIYEEEQEQVQQLIASSATSRRKEREKQHARQM